MVLGSPHDGYGLAASRDLFHGRDLFFFSLLSSLCDGVGRIFFLPLKNGPPIFSFPFTVKFSRVVNIMQMKGKFSLVG